MAIEGYIIFLSDLVGDPPLLKPLQMFPLLVAALHAKHHRPKQIEQPYDNSVENAIHAPLNAPIFPRQRLCKPIHHETHREDRKVQRGVVMMHIRNTRHCDEREIM